MLYVGSITPSAKRGVSILKVLILKKEYFIEKAVAVHGNKFDYSLLPDEFKTTDKVNIICGLHGEFYMEANSHVSRKSICPKCANILKNIKVKSQSINNFPNKAAEVHNGRYDYSLVVYETNKKPVVIICPVHGEFKQAPYNHLNGQGCKKCADTLNGINSRLTTESFITKSNVIHGGIYDYSTTEYVTQKTLLDIGCAKHGIFKMTGNSHLNGQGCPLCGVERRSLAIRSDTEDFVNKAISLHEDTYSYAFVEYKTSTTPVIITCKTHGNFLQKPSHHLMGSGCSSCSAGGYDPAKVGTFYIINVSGKFLKFGISNNPNQRIKDLRRNTTYDLTYLFKFEFADGSVPVEIEKTVKSILVCGVVDKSKMLHGFTETTSFDNLSKILEIVETNKPT